MSALDHWRDYVESHDHRALWDLLHPDAVFESPVVHTPQRGREIAFKYLASALQRDALNDCVTRKWRANQISLSESSQSGRKSNSPQTHQPRSLL